MKKFFCLILSLFALMSASCRARGAAADVPAPISEHFVSESSATEPPKPSAPDVSKDLPQLPAKEKTEAEPVWNTADTDVSRVDANKKLIAFTFDDAPNNKTLNDLVAAFSAFNEKNPDCPASATLFTSGIRVTSSTFSALQSAFAAGFELGNHTWSHKNLTKLTPEKVRSEIDTVDKVLQQIDGKERHLVRAPYGEMNAAVKSEVEVPLIYWTIDTEDWKKLPVYQIYKAVDSKKYSGAIVLMHDGYPNTVEAVKQLLPSLKAQGFQVVSVSQLSKALGCPFYTGQVYTRVQSEK